MTNQVQEIYVFLILKNDNYKSSNCDIRDSSIVATAATEELAIAMVKQFNDALEERSPEEPIRDSSFHFYFDYTKQLLTTTLSKPLYNKHKEGDIVEFEVVNIKIEPDYGSFVEVELTALGFYPVSSQAHKDRYKIGDKISLRVDDDGAFWEIRDSQLVELRGAEEPDLIGPELYPEPPKEPAKPTPSLGDLC